MAATDTRTRSVDVVDLTGASVGTVDLAPKWFGIEPNVPVMHQVVTAQRAAARRGTSKTKRRGEVRGGGRKPWRQKGTGRARQGSTRSPQWTGGGIVHGPSGEQNYTKRVSKKLKRLALASALSDRAAGEQVRVVRGLEFDEPKTKNAVGMLLALELANTRVLVVLDRWDQAVVKSFRNLQGVHLLSIDQLNTYDVVVSDVVVFAEGALDYLGTGTRADLAARDEAGAEEEAR